MKPLEMIMICYLTAMNMNRFFSYAIGKPESTDENKGETVVFDLQFCLAV